MRYTYKILVTDLIINVPNHEAKSIVFWTTLLRLILARVKMTIHSYSYSWSICNQIFADLIKVQKIRQPSMTCSLNGFPWLTEWFMCFFFTAQIHHAFFRHSLMMASCLFLSDPIIFLGLNPFLKASYIIVHIY